ncbi:MAG TPA: AI-2E family transporter, partial [Gemmatimonadales bacterium]
MTIFDTSHQRAAIVLLLLAAGLAIALAPYTTGIIGAPVLYVIFAPLNEYLRKHVRPSLAGIIIIVLALLVFVAPGIWFATLVVAQAQQMAQGVRPSSLLQGVSTLSIGGFKLGPTIADLGKTLVSWVGSSAFGLIGTATRIGINLTIAFFGLYYLLLRPTEIWRSARPYIPFSRDNAEMLRQRFRDVTTSTLIGTGAVALAQGLLFTFAFSVLGFDNAIFWGLVIAVFAALPVVGSALIWAPAALSLALDQRYSAAVTLVVCGTLVVGVVDNFIRPFVYRRYLD